jgi:hypothetical protein
MRSMPWGSTIAPMNSATTSVAAGLAAVLLGITAAGAILFGAIVPMAVLGSSWGNDAVGLVIVAVGVASIAFGLVSGYAAVAVATGRPAGTLIGLGVGAVTLIGTAVASAYGGFQPPMAAGFLLGGGVVSALAVPLWRVTPSQLTDIPPMAGAGSR